MSSPNYKTTPTHVSLIQHGDTILVDGKLKTVCGSDIKRGFMGTTIFGDSYKLGTTPVQKATFIQSNSKPSSGPQSTQL